MTPAQIRLIGAALLLALLALGQWYWLHSEYRAGQQDVQVRWDADKISRDEAQKTALLAYANRITQAQEQHDHDQAAIDDLSQRARGMRLHLPACGDTAAAGADPDGGSRLLSKRVDEGFGRLQDRAGQLLARCDQLNIDARRLNGELVAEDEAAKRKMAGIIKDLGRGP